MEKEDLNAARARNPEHPRPPGTGSAASAFPKITGATVRDDFNHIRTVIHYTKAAHTLGLWKSERVLLDRFFPDKSARLLEAGCGAGRVTIALWELGYRELTAFDFASELIEQAESLAAERGAAGIRFLQADATRLLDYVPPVAGPINAAARRAEPAAPAESHVLRDNAFDGALFMFNGLMQIPGRANRRAALAGIAGLCRPGAVFLFSTHDRDDPKEAKLWGKEAARWARGEQDPRLVEFGDRYFSDDNGNTFMHLPDRREVLADLTATGWRLEYTALRDELASETPMVRNFSDNCRFWVAVRK